jgi:hypothetical protein
MKLQAIFAALAFSGVLSQEDFVEKDLCEENDGHTAECVIHRNEADLVMTETLTDLVIAAKRAFTQDLEEEE